MIIPTDGRMTSFQAVPAALTGGELLWIVQPGNAAGGVLYNVSTATLAAFFYGYPFFNTIEILTGATVGVPFPVPTTATRILVNKTAPSASYLTFPLAATMATQFPILIKDFAGNANVDNINISFSGGENCDGQTTLVIANNYGWVTINPNPGGGGWYQS